MPTKFLVTIGAGAAAGIFLTLAIQGAGPSAGLLSRETSDLAKAGRIEPEQFCSLHESFNTMLNNKFAAMARNGKRNPAYVITKDDCIDLLAAKNPTPRP